MRLAALVAALLVSFSAAAAAAPSPVSAWYAYGSSPAALASYAYARGCDFARSQPGTGSRLLLLDFGAARKLNAGTWGTIDFSNAAVSNADILAALKAAADGYHSCHVRGSPARSEAQPFLAGCSARTYPSRSLRRSCACAAAGS